MVIHGKRAKMKAMSKRKFRESRRNPNPDRPPGRWALPPVVINPVAYVGQSNAAQGFHQVAMTEEDIRRNEPRDPGVGSRLYPIPEAEDEVQRDPDKLSEEV
jgi:hypothetical protein